MTASSKHYRVAYLVTHPIQYQAPMLRMLADQPQIDLNVYFLSDQGATEYLDRQFKQRFKWDIPLLEGYTYQIVPDRRAISTPFGVAKFAIVGELRRQRYDALIVHGYNNPSYLLAYLGAWLADTPYLLHGESNLLDDRPMARRAIKEGALRALFGRAGGALYIGEANYRYYVRYGMAEDRLFFAPYCVDNNFFGQCATELLPMKRELRSEFGINDDAPVVLFCGKLMDKKRPQDMLQAFAQARGHRPCHLLYIGDGELRGEIEERVARQQIPDVHLAGFKNQTEIPRAYAAADMLVLPSAYGETWGLVINEAMNFGLPIIASDRVGASHNLIEQGANGYVVPARDIQSLSEAILGLVDDSSRREAFGRRSQEIIKDWGIEAHVAGIVEGVETVVSRHKARGSTS